MMCGAIDRRNCAQTPCGTNMMMYTAVPIVAVSSRGLPVNGVVDPFAYRELTNNAATIRILAVRAAVGFAVGIVVRIIVVEYTGQSQFTPVALRQSASWDGACVGLGELSVRRGRLIILVGAGGNYFRDGTVQSRFTMFFIFLAFFGPQIQQRVK